MGMCLAVKTRLICAALVCWSGFASAEPVPDAREILRTVRLAQASQHQVLRGRLRTGGKVSPFRLVIDGPIIRYEFSDPAQIIQLRLLERDSRLEEVTPGGTQRIASARFDDTVRGSDITYEDLAMKFLYWPNATVEGEQTMLLRRCWKLHVEPSAKGESQYRAVILWIDKASGALMQAEAFDATGKFARRFKVISGQKIEGAWLLKSMRIEAAVGPRGEDRSPTYLEIEGIEKG
jgi:Outer membrane lipoprotein-sorting protein